MKWQPIETAPKDGRVILGWRFYPVAIRLAGNGEWEWEAVQLGSNIPLPLYFNGFSEGDVNLTHWMPLPTPPEDSK